MSADVTLAGIKAARERIRPYMAGSAVKESMFLQKRTGLKCVLKLENLNLSGSFKIRGALNSLLQILPSDLSQGILAASAGNHAQGIAYTCRELNAKATIFMPERTPLIKAEATRELGAHVVLGGMSYDDAYQAAVEHQKQHGGIFIHAFSDPRVICGQGTVGLELLEQVDNLGLVMVPIGGGGLASGVATAIKALKPEVKIIGVQAAAYPALERSRREGHVVAAAVGTTIADGIAIKQPTDLTLGIVQKYVDEVVLVDEESIASAVMDLMEWDHMLAEGAGAASVAGLLKLPPSVLAGMAGKTVACIVSGGNIDVNLLKRIIPNGLKHAGRLMRLAVRIVDRPGRLAELLNLVSRTGANLQDVTHNRLFNAVGYDDVEVQLDLETLDLKHQHEIMEMLGKSKFRFSKLD
jgi:threonine dehydratase